jgi:hypothetical protein
MKKPHSPITPLIILSLCGIVLAPATASADRASSRLDTRSEIFRWADRDGNNNLNATERDLLRIAFAGRSDLRILDLNRNQKLDREEIDELEKGRVKKKKGKGKNGKKRK